MKYRKKTHRKRTLRKYTQRKGKTRSRRIRGGNYQTDVTTRTYEGFPMKPANKVVTTVPGRGVMSVSAYAKMMEDLDRNGSDYYD